MNALEQMRGITRDGDKIGAEDRNRDDNVFALALGVRFWEDRFRRQLIAGNRTREAERARVSLLPQDRYNLFHKNMLGDFFKVKETARASASQRAFRASWRGAVGMNRHSQRRW